MGKDDAEEEDQDSESSETPPDKHESKYGKPLRKRIIQTLESALRSDCYDALPSPGIKKTVTSSYNENKYSFTNSENPSGSNYNFYFH